MRSVVLGTGRAVPARVVTNADLAALMDTSDEWIRSRTGIQERRWIEPGERGVTLGKLAALEALAMAGWRPAELDAIVYATSTPDHFLPGNGVYLQRELGIAATIPALDIRMQCAGFIYALSVADAYIRTGAFRRILVVGQEIQSTRMDVSTEGRYTAVIFADGAGAVALGATDADARGILAFDLHGDG
ncbi:MAG TPA: 3-oxoacyl-ACP synthase, partial [Gemmatimonadales bacterium]|nr:3-oxoacyl-ACP synthase [Gemmatimonadales bacterium]